MKVACSSGLMCMVFAVILTCGCSGDGKIKTNIVEGTVTYNGQPLVGATVNFHPTDGGNQGYGNTDVQGRYKLQTLLGQADAGTTAGEYVVTISHYDNIPTGRKIQGDDGSMLDETVSKPGIPEAYMDRASTPFKRTVVSGRNTFDFALTSDGQ